VAEERFRLPDGWEYVIGLEVHTELRTTTKLFCGCPNSFGEEPNTSICPVCLGLPGSLPVLNERAVELAIRVGLALGATIQRSQFHRKNYFYPDMPKDYQISQYDVPINLGGSLTLPSGRVIGIVRAHLEEDTGKLVHRGGSGRIEAAEYSLVDYNRAGVPLLEIVSEPDIRDPEEARAYVAELRGILVAVGASDGRMEEGSLRVDANVSVRPVGDPTMRTRVEIKNLNSLRSLGRALAYEGTRQVEAYTSGGTVVQETRFFDEGRGVTGALRRKEDANDYRYFPEPDLPPLVPEEALLARLRATQPELPTERRARLRALADGLSEDVVVTVTTEELWPYLASCLDAGLDPALAARRTANELAAMLAELAHLDAARFVEVVALEASGELAASQAKVLLKAANDDPAPVAELQARLGLGASDADEVRALVAAVVAEFPAEWQRFVDGDAKVGGFLVGQVMRRHGKTMDGQAARRALDELARAEQEGA
jgi:aspartyl-tRNA(Asn)/glutamyl-tRNA(Gln) amidotransferase subunit B